MQAMILGAAGQLGVELSTELRRRDYRVLAFDRKQLDITSPEAVEAVFSRHKPALVFNCAAYNFVDLAEKEPEAAMRVNGLAVRLLSMGAQRVGATFVHYSTDHVFGGDKGSPYVEEDQPAPPSAYGVSKLAGEYYARAYCERVYVIRVAGVFGPAGRHTNRGNFPELVLKKADEGSLLRVVEDFTSTPTYAPALAARSIDLTEKAEPGLYHIGGGETISWYRYALKIVEVAHRQAPIEPTDHGEYVTAARRPRHSSLSNGKMEAAGLDPMPPLSDALTDYLKRR